MSSEDADLGESLLIAGGEVQPVFMALGFCEILKVNSCPPLSPEVNQTLRGRG